MVVGGTCFKLYQILRHGEFMNGNSFNWPVIETLCFCKERGKTFYKNEEKSHLFLKSSSA